MDLKTYAEFWESTLALIKEDRNIKSTSYKSWFEPLEVLDGKKHIIYLGTKVPFILDWINDHYNDIVVQYLKKASEEKVTDFRMVLIQADGSYHIEEEIIEEKPVSAGQHIKEEKKLEEIDDLYTTSLNPRYTFDSFVVGEYNRLAHAASLAVAECPGKVYNPLFIQGGVGLGKTHLMQAIGHFIKENNRNAKVAYFTTENFVNEWIQAIKNNTPDQFRAKYRKVDVILMDDIQFLADKVSSQEEFFHTYNALYESGAQIILSSDRPAYEISQLEERLASRFIWGLSTEFMSPDLETRIAILQKKAALNNIVIPAKDNEVFYYIAHQYDSNIRVLESALNRVNAYSKMVGEPITYSLAMKALENFFPEHRTKAITVELILQTAAKYFKIKPEDMRSQKRTALITYPRQIAMYLCRELTDATFEQIGKEFGNRHYTTVMHASNEIAERVKTNKATQKEVKEITESVRKM